MYVVYTRNIIINDIVDINDYDLIYLTGTNIAQYLLELMKGLCAQCGKNTASSNDIIIMKCQCQFCKECLMQNLQAATNGEMLLNKFERNYGEKYGCLCKNVFDPDEAFKLLKIDPKPYRLNAQLRMNQYVSVFCIICGLQILDPTEDMLVNSNRMNDNYFKFKIKKPDNYKPRNDSVHSERSKQGTNRTGDTNAIDVNNNNNNEEYNEVSYNIHIMCTNCIEKELQKDSCEEGDGGNKGNNGKVFMCKICEVEHVIEKTEWNKIFKKACCSGCCVV